MASERDYSNQECPYRWGLNRDPRCIKGGCAFWIIIRSYTHECQQAYEWGCGLVHRPRK